MIRMLLSLMGGVLAVTASTAAEAAFDWQFYESGSFLSKVPSSGDVTNLDEADGNVDAPRIGPGGKKTKFTEVGQRIRVVGALNVATDAFSVEFTEVPSLKLIINELIFFEKKTNPNETDNPQTNNRIDGGKFAVSLGNESDPSMTFKAGDTLTTAYASLTGVSSFTLDNVDGTDLIAYDIDVVATPLPGALVLFGTGVAGIAGYRRLFKKAA